MKKAEVLSKTKAGCEPAQRPAEVVHRLNDLLLLAERGKPPQTNANITKLAGGGYVILAEEGKGQQGVVVIQKDGKGQQGADELQEVSKRLQKILQEARAQKASIEAQGYWLGLGVESVQGLLIRCVLPDSPAAKAGLKSQDVLVGVNGKPLKTVAELIEMVQKAQGSTWSSTCSATARCRRSRSSR